MGYESKFDYDFSSKPYIKNIKELNNEIAKLKGGMSEVKVIKAIDNDFDYVIKLDDFNGQFYDEKEFAELLSKYMDKGYVDLKYEGEDGALWGYRVYPNKVKDLKFTIEPVD
jgi:hypothetical protein